MTDSTGMTDQAAGLAGSLAVSEPTLFLYAPVAGLLVRQDGWIKGINRQAAALLLGGEQAAAMMPDRTGDPATDAAYVFLRFIEEQDQSIAMSYLAAVLRDRQQHLLDLHLRALDGRAVPVRLLAGPVPGDPDTVQIIILDAERQQVDEDTLNHRANYDQLTGLPNRHLFYDRLHWAIRDARRQNERLAVMMVDLDNFSQVNNTLGHEAGDRLLQAVSSRMSACLRDVDTLSRLGGDEFTILLQHILDAPGAAMIAERLMEAIRQPVIIADKPQRVNASIGICLYPDDGDSADVLLYNADIAMYRSKNSGRNSMSFFSESLKAAVNHQIDLENSLRLALQASELEVWYQPLVDAASSRIIGLEALLRWRSEKEGVMTAGQFLPIAESLGLVGSFGEWAMLKACSQMKDWLDRGIIQKGGYRMAVNLGREQLSQPDIADKVREALQASGLPANELAVETSEATLQDENQVVLDNLLRLRKMGIALHLDDFSQGLNSLQKINAVKFDCLKIDQNYTSVFLENKRGEALLEALVNLSHNLGLRVIAEGIESQHAYAWFKQHACDGMQGYYFCRPLPAIEIEMLLNLRQ
jgi:diguanylate cyclase (GGDEF)-like protein